VLTAAGYDDLASGAVVRGLEAVLRSSVARDVLRVATDAVQRVEVLEVLRAGHLELLLGEGDVVAKRIYQAVLRGVVTQADRDEILDGIAAALGKADADVRTLYDTSTSIFTRQAQVLDTEDDTAFLYAGPIDARLRPFCEDHVGKVYTKDRIAQMDNGQLPNCLLSGGGYNCRHIWQPLSAFSDLRAYTNTGARAPEFAAQLANRPKVAFTRYGRRAA